MERGFGLLIGAGFGVAFVFANSPGPLNVAVASVLMALAMLAFVALIAMVVVMHGRDDEAAAAAWRRPGAARRFLVVVCAEAAAIAAGIVVLRIFSAPEEANVAWIALVVGIHLVAFVAVWHGRTIIVPGVILTALGIAGLVMTATSAGEWTPFISGVLSGFTLIVFGVGYAGRELWITEPVEDE
jgi:hypothetical protein